MGEGNGFELKFLDHRYLRMDVRVRFVLSCLSAKESVLCHPSGGGILAVFYMPFKFLIFANVTGDRFLKMLSLPSSEICLSRHSVVLELLGISRFWVAHRFTCWDLVYACGCCGCL